jgi:hypothetical protein
MAFASGQRLLWMEASIGREVYASIVFSVIYRWVLEHITSRRDTHSIGPAYGRAACS